MTKNKYLAQKSSHLESLDLRPRSCNLQKLLKVFQHIPQSLGEDDNFTKEYKAILKIEVTHTPLQQSLKW